MYMFGSTIGPAAYPSYIHNGKKKMLPRPVVLSLPGNLGHLMMQNNIWLKDLSQDIYQLCLHHLQHDDNEKSKCILIFVL